MFNSDQFHFIHFQSKIFHSWHRAPSKQCIELRACRLTSSSSATLFTWIQVPSCFRWRPRRTLLTPRTRASIRSWRISTTTLDQRRNLRGWPCGFGPQHRHQCPWPFWTWIHHHRPRRSPPRTRSQQTKKWPRTRLSSQRQTPMGMMQPFNILKRCFSTRCSPGWPCPMICKRRCKHRSTWQLMRWRPTSRRRG